MQELSVSEVGVKQLNNQKVKFLTFKSSLVFLLSILLWSPLTLANRFIETRAVTRADLYTGENNASTLEYISLENWLAYRSETELVDDITIAERSFIIDDYEALTEIYTIANQLLSNWPGTTPEIAIFFKSGSLFSFNAETTYSNEILVDLAIVRNAQSRDEVAAILAHELSHILLGHNKKLSYISTASELFENYTNASEFVTSVEAAEFDSDTGEVSFTLDNEYQQKITKIQNNQELAVRYYNTAHASLFSRGNEIKADKLAIDLLIAGGYSANGLNDAFSGLANSYELNELISKTLMDTAEGLMTDAADEIQSMLVDTAQEDLSSMSFRNIFSGAGSIFKNVTADVSRNYFLNRFESMHPVPQKRRKEFVEYLSNEYGRTERRRSVDREAWVEYKSLPGIANLLRNHENLMNAYQYAVNGDFDNANTTLNEIQSFGRIEYGFFDFISYKVFEMQGQSNDAYSNLKNISLYNSIPNFAANDMVDFLLEQNNADIQINEIMSQKESYLGLISGFYPAKIQLAQRSGESEQVVVLAKECIQNFDNDDELYSYCANLAGISAAEPQQSRGLFGVLNNAGSSLREAANSLNGNDD